MYNGSGVGDIVVHHTDASNNIKCYGTVIETEGNGIQSQCLVMWSSESSPLSWHYSGELITVNQKEEEND